MCVQPVFDKDGDCVAWLSERTLFTPDGGPLGFIDGHAVFAFDGSHRGWYDDGYLWDGDGRAVAFLVSAFGGPLKPFPKAVPPVPEPVIPPAPPLPREAGTPPGLHRDGWSSLRFADLVT